MGGTGARVYDYGSIIIIIRLIHQYLLLFYAVVATDDDRIAECCRGFGADVIMTSDSCKNGIILNSLWKELGYLNNQNSIFMHEF